MGLETLFDWGKEQAKYVLFLGLFVVLIVTAFKRAWIAMIGAFVGLSFIAIFIANPEVIIDVGDWISRTLSIGR